MDTKNEQPKKSGRRGGARKGTGPKPGKPHSGQFKPGGAGHILPQNKRLRESLIAIIQMDAGKMPDVLTNADLLAARLWEYAMTAAPSNPKGLNAITEIFDRVDGKSAPSPEELNSAEKAKTVTIMMPRTDKKTDE